MKNRDEKIWGFSIILLCLLYFTIGLIFKPIVISDAIRGMLSLHNYLNGGGWNKMLTFSPDDNIISSGELTWWAPGQYAIPYILSKLTSLNIGAVITILMFVSVIAGSYFYYKLFKLSGLRNTLILSAILILLTQRFINIYFIQYSSPDLLLFFYTPFYIYAYHYLLQTYDQKTGFKLFSFIILNLLGLFIKNSFLILELALNIFLLFEVITSYKRSQKAPGKKPDRIHLLYKSLIILPFIFAALLNYYFFLRLGENPTIGNQSALTFTSVLKGIFIPVMETLFASISLSGISGNLYGAVHLSEVSQDLFFIVVLLIIGYIIYANRKALTARFKSDIIFRSAVVIAIVYVTCWFGFAIKSSSISNEDRLFLPATLLIFPFLLDFIVTTRSKVRYLYIVIIGFSMIYGISSFALRLKKYSSNGAVFSKDSKLNGFKVFIANKSGETELNHISKLIASDLPDYHIIIINPDIAFQLRVANPFIIASRSPIRVTRPNDKKLKYVVLSEVGQGTPPSGLTKIYSSERYQLYRSN